MRGSTAEELQTLSDHQASPSNDKSRRGSQDKHAHADAHSNHTPSSDHDSSSSCCSPLGCLKSLGVAIDIVTRLGITGRGKRAAQEKGNEDLSVAEDWRNSLRIVLVPTTLLVLFALVPLSEDVNSGVNPQAKQSFLLFVFAFHFIYHLVACWFGFNLFGLFLPTPSRRSCILYSLLASALGAGFDLVARELTRSEPLVFRWLVPFSVAPATLVIFGVMFRQTRRMQDYLQLVLQKLRTTNKVMARYSSAASERASVLREAEAGQSSSSSSASSSGMGSTYDHSVVELTFEGANGSQVTIKVDTLQLLEAPKSMYWQLVTFAAAILVTYVFCILYSFWFLRQTDTESRILVSTLFSFAVAPFQAVLTFLGNRLDSTRGEVRNFLAQTSRVKGVRKGTSGARELLDDAGKSTALEDTTLVTGEYARGVTMKFLGVWVGRLFQSLYFRNLFLGLKDYQSFLTLVAFEVAMTLLLFWLRLFRWFYRYLEMPVRDCLTGCASWLQDTTCCSCLGICTRSLTHEDSQGGLKTQRERQLDALDQANQKTLNDNRLSVAIGVSRKGGGQSSSSSSSSSSPPSSSSSSGVTMAVGAGGSLTAPTVELTKEEQFEERLLAHRTMLVSKYYWYAMAQRFSTISFLILALLLRNSWNVFAFSFRQSSMSDASYALILEFAGISLAVEWVLASVLWYWDKEKYGLDMIYLGAAPLRETRFYLCTLLAGIHISQDVLLATNSFIFA